MKLYRAISLLEKEDVENRKQFRCIATSLEVKQFFKTKKAALKYVKLARKRDFRPPYLFIVDLELAMDAEIELKMVDINLDTFDAVYIDGDDLGLFQKKINFMQIYEIGDNL